MSLFIIVLMQAVLKVKVRGKYIDVERSNTLRARKKDKRVSYIPTWKHVVCQLNMFFENMKKLGEALSKYTIERGCQLNMIHNDQRRGRVKCKASGCP